MGLGAPESAQMDVETAQMDFETTHKLESQPQLDTFILKESSFLLVLGLSGAFWD